jgi:inorganic triphosphatase YgiF
MEIELKLLIDPKHLAKLRRHALLRQHALAKPREQALTSIYFDTPGLELWSKGMALRVRQTPDGWLQAFKGGGTASGGLHRREEWEGPTDGPGLNLGKLRALIGPHESSGELLRQPRLTGRLQAIFATRVTRTLWDLHLPGGADIEFALDRGTVVCGKQVLPICEVELELKSGEAGQLFDFALRLLESIPLRIGNISKAERGFALCDPQPPRVVGASRIVLSRHMTVMQGFRAIAAACMAQLEGNEAGVAAGRDPESLHQMRVGLRRLRSALRLFRDVIACPAGVQEDMAWLGAELGAARDWDVLTGTTLPALAAQLPGCAEVEAVRKAASELAEAKREKAIAAVNSARFTRLVLTLHRWLPEAAAPETPLREFADEMLTRAHRRLLKSGKHLRDAPHRVRIAAKRTRYATEFLQSLYSAKRIDGYTRLLSALQDELGRLNDAAVASGLLQEMSQLRPELGAETGFVRGYLAAVARDQRKSKKLWKRLDRVKPPCDGK